MSRPEDKALGYVSDVIELLTWVEEEQPDDLIKAAELMAQAILEDRLTNVYSGGSHITLSVGEMFFRAGDLSNSIPFWKMALLSSIRL